jgi:uncharacterized protein (TIGR03118 family)
MVNKVLPSRLVCVTSAGLLSLSTILTAQPTQHYTQTNLVADLPGVAATTDPNLVNAWGMSRSSGSPWWVSDNGTGRTTLYNGAGAAQALVVTIPPGDASSGKAGNPTGQVFNGTTGFELVPTKPAVFIFVTEDGTVSGWNPGVNPTKAVIKVNTKGDAVFKGAALASVTSPSGATATFLYAADFRNRLVRVYDSSFHRMLLGEHAFEDERIPHSFGPFNVQNIGGNIYVAFAKRDAERRDEVDGAGLGYVDVFSPTGRLLHRLEHNAWLNAPWGITQAPADFGAFSHDILVGQFGSGQIIAFDPVTGRSKGPLYAANNTPITIDGLWGIAFGGGGAGSGPSTSLFFTAGPGGEQHGLFGAITAVENVLGGDQ